MRHSPCNRAQHSAVMLANGERDRWATSHPTFHFRRLFLLDYIFPENDKHPADVGHLLPGSSCHPPASACCYWFVSHQHLSNPLHHLLHDHVFVFSLNTQREIGFKHLPTNKDKAFRLPGTSAKVIGGRQDAKKKNNEKKTF